MAPAAANTICVGLLSQYPSPFDVAGSLPMPHSISEFFHILGRYFHETRGSLNFHSQNLAIFDFKKCRDLEMGSKVTQGH